jgi:hypothetical protein
MNEETKMEENRLFYYLGSDGKTYYTPNEEFAHAQARKYGTKKVFMEKY